LDSEDKKNDVFSAFDEIDLNDNEMNDDEDEENEEDDEENNSDEYQKVMIDNEYVAEKLSAIYCLEEISKYQNPLLIDFYNDCYEELKRLSLFVNLNIRKESYSAIANLISYFHDYCIVNINKADMLLQETMIRSKFFDSF
jgi:hypothetical protein